MSPISLANLSKEQLLGVVILLIWAFFWKGFALWTAVKNNHKNWFIAILVLNTFGIIEIIYLFAIAKKEWSDVAALFRGNKEPLGPTQNT